MKIINYFTTFQEVPDNLSLCFSVYGCPYNCYNCSWKNEKNYLEMSLENIYSIVNKNREFIDCVCFLGGEWEPEIKEALSYCKKIGLLTCLYTGCDNFTDREIISNLDFLKTGHYEESLGGLSSKSTNQKFIDLRTNECINYKFWKF